MTADLPQRPRHWRELVLVWALVLLGHALVLRALVLGLPVAVAKGLGEEQPAAVMTLVTLAQPGETAAMATRTTAASPTAAQAAPPPPAPTPAPTPAPKGNDGPPPADADVKPAKDTPPAPPSPAPDAVPAESPAEDAATATAVVAAQTPTDPPADPPAEPPAPPAPEPSAPPPAPFDAVTAVAAVAASASAPAPSAQQRGHPMAPFGSLMELAPPPPGVVATAAPAQQLALRYVATQGGGRGHAWLQWATTAEGAYRAVLTVQGAGLPAIDWDSSGQIDVLGIAPLRMVERRNGRAQRAVNFQRDKGLITFSGSAAELPLSPGAQDRVTWMVQLASLARVLVQRGQLAPGARISLPVAGPRGWADQWLFEAGAPVERELAGQMVRMVPLRREPVHPYDLRLVLWVALSHEAYPVGASWAVVPGGAPLELWVADGLPSNQ